MKDLHIVIQNRSNRRNRRFPSFCNARGHRSIQCCTPRVAAEGSNNTLKLVEDAQGMSKLQDFKSMPHPLIEQHKSRCRSASSMSTGHYSLTSTSTSGRGEDPSNTDHSGCMRDTPENRNHQRSQNFISLPVSKKPDPGFRRAGIVGNLHPHSAVWAYEHLIAAIWPRLLRSCSTINGITPDCVIVDVIKLLSTAPIDVRTPL